MQFADRLQNVETSAIRELFKLLGKPGIISFAGGFPDSALFDVDGIRAASQQALQGDSGAALQYGATEGYQPLREQLSAFMASKGAQGVAPENLIVTTGSQQALDLLGKTLINPGDKVIVEGPTFLATIQPTRRPGESTLLRLPQWMSNSRLPGTLADSASKLGGGGASPKYRSPYGSSSTMVVWYWTASSSTFLRRSRLSSAPLGLPKVGMR